MVSALLSLQRRGTISVEGYLYQNTVIAPSMPSVLSSASAKTSLHLISL